MSNKKKGIRVLRKKKECRVFRTYYSNFVITILRCFVYVTANTNTNSNTNSDNKKRQTNTF